MRERDEIKKEVIENMKNAGPNHFHGATIVDLLLDIRDLLTNIKHDTIN